MIAFRFNVNFIINLAKRIVKSFQIEDIHRLNFNFLFKNYNKVHRHNISFCFNLAIMKYKKELILLFLFINFKDQKIAMKSDMKLW